MNGRAAIAGQPQVLGEQEKEPWPERKTKYLGKLPHVQASSLLLSASDKLHNARTIPTDVLTLPQEERDTCFTRFNRR